MPKGIGERISDSFLCNPMAWLLLAAFLIAEYGNYRRGVQLDQVCEAHYPNVTKIHPQTPQEIADSICVARRED
jgi:hypothetical protein